MSPQRPELTRSDPLHLQIARHIRNDIAAGVLRSGEVLPSSRELAEEWSVSVFAISEAMKTLAAEGLVVSKSRARRAVQATQPNEDDEVRLG